jgi:hypothetical protein
MIKHQQKHQKNIKKSSKNIQKLFKMINKTQKFFTLPTHQKNPLSFEKKGVLSPQQLKKNTTHNTSNTNKIKQKTFTTSFIRSITTPNTSTHSTSKTKQKQ